MEPRPKLAPAPKDQLEGSKQALAGRNTRIMELEAANRAAEGAIKVRNHQMGLLLDANEFEKRILVLLNYLAVRPDEDKENLLRAEREAQAIVLATLEASCSITP